MATPEATHKSNHYNTDATVAVGLTTRKMLESFTLEPERVLELISSSRVITIVTAYY